MSTGKTVLGVLAGLAAGATLGILFAPDKGTNTRKKISKKGDDYMDGLKDKFNELFEAAKDEFDGAKEKVENTVDKGTSKAHEFKKDVRNAVHTKMDGQV